MASGRCCCVSTLHAKLQMACKIYAMQIALALIQGGISWSTSMPCCRPHGCKLQDVLHVFCSTSQGQQEQLKQQCQRLADELAAAHAAVIEEQQQHHITVCELQRQVAELQQQIVATKQAADASEGAAASAERMAALAEASAREAANKLQAAAVVKDQLRLDLEQQLQAAQWTLQERLSSSANALAKGQQEVESLQQSLDVAMQESKATQAANAELSDSLSQLTSQLLDAQTALTSESDGNAAAVSQLHSQVDTLKRQLADVQQEAEEAAAQAASLQHAARTAEQRHQASAVLLQETVTDQTQAANELEKRLFASQDALQQASNLAAAETASHQQDVDNLQAKLDASVEQSTAVQALNSQLADAVQQLRIQLQNGKIAMAKQVEANEEAVTGLHSQVETLQQQLDSVSQEAAAAIEEATVVAAAAAASHHAAAAVLQESAAEKDAVIISLKSSLQAAQTELQQATAAADASQADSQQSMQLLHQRLHDTQQQSQDLTCSTAQLSATVSHLTQQLDAAREAAVEQTESSSQAVADLQTQADLLQKELDNALQAADAAAADAAAHSSTAAAAEAAGALAQEAAAVLEQTVAARNLEGHVLKEKLQSTQAALDCAAAVAAHTDAQRQQEILSVQAELDDARVQVRISEASSIETADRVRQLQAQLDSAQQAQNEQSTASSAEITQLQQQVGGLQQQLTAAKEATDAAAAEVAVLTQQASITEAAHLAEAAALQQKAEDQTRLVRSLAQQLQAAQTELQQATASAAVMHQDDQRSLEALQQRLQDAHEGSGGLQGDNSELAGRLAQARSELESVQMTLANQSAASHTSLVQLQSQVQGLHAQLAAAKQTADAQMEAGREHTTDHNVDGSASGQDMGQAADQQGARSSPAASSASQLAAENEGAEHLAAAEVLRAQLSSLSQEMIDLQHDVHAAQLDQAAAQQSEAMMFCHSDSLQLQVNHLCQGCALLGCKLQATMAWSLP